MSQTLAELREDVLDHLDGSLTGFWSTDQLNRWIGEAVREVARRTEVLQDVKSYTLVADQISYPLPEDMIRIYRVEYRDGAGYIKPLEFQTFHNLDDVWYWGRESSGSQPAFFTIWGYPGMDGSGLYIYPLSSTTIADGLRVFYYRLPRKMLEDSDQADLPAGWEDLVPLYVEVVARRKEARDQRWQEALQLFENRLEQMVEVTRQWTDQSSEQLAMDGARPYWLGDGW